MVSCADMALTTVLCIDMACLSRLGMSNLLNAICH